MQLLKRKIKVCDLKKFQTFFFGFFEDGYGVAEIDFIKKIMLLRKIVKIIFSWRFLFIQLNKFLVNDAIPQKKIIC